MNKKHRVTLTEEERASLGRRVAAGTAPAHDLLHARILLKADDGANGPSWTDATIATALEVSTPTVERVRKRFCEQGLEAAIRRRRPRRAAACVGPYRALWQPPRQASQCPGGRAAASP
jgi:hypothetical protein